MEINKKFWSGKKVLVTGHTGFKGAWLVMYLNKLGASICGVSLPPPTKPSLYDLCNLESKNENHFCDIRNFNELNKIFNDFNPEIVFHLAAQPLVGYSYKNPIETYQTNVIGTLNVLEAIRFNKSVKAGVMITTDKCYKNNEWEWGYRENDELGGHDPYSSSKAAAEILIKSYSDSFFNNDKRLVNIASVRAGNVIGGGDWAEDRLIPDIFKSIFNNKVIMLRNPNAVRPWQHVLDPLSGYISLAQKLYSGDNKFVGAWNFGPDYKETKTVSEIIDFIKTKTKFKINVKLMDKVIYKETSFLKLDSTKALSFLNWQSVWTINETLEKTLEWYLAFKENKDLSLFSEHQINSYINKSNLF